MYKATDQAALSSKYIQYTYHFMSNKEKKLYKNVKTCLKIRALKLKMQNVTSQSVINITGNLDVVSTCPLTRFWNTQEKIFVFLCQYLWKTNRITLQFTVYTSIQIPAVTSQSIIPCCGSYERPGAGETSPSMRMSPCTRCIHKELLRKFPFCFEEDDPILPFAG